MVRGVPELQASRAVTWAATADALPEVSRGVLRRAGRTVLARQPDGQERPGASPALLEYRSSWSSQATGKSLSVRPGGEGRASPPAPCRSDGPHPLAPSPFGRGGTMEGLSRASRRSASRRSQLTSPRSVVVLPASAAANHHGARRSLVPAPARCARVNSRLGLWPVNRPALIGPRFSGRGRAALQPRSGGAPRLRAPAPGRRLGVSIRPSSCGAARPGGSREARRRSFQRRLARRTDRGRRTRRLSRCGIHPGEAPRRSKGSSS